MFDTRMRSLLILLPALAAGPAAAQQFQYQPGMIPGAANWAEGVEAADVDLDGDLDLFFAEGEGFVSAGPKRQNVLMINQRVESGSLSFTDESVARLGTHVSNAKGVATGDVDGDGWVDAVFANGFNTDRPFLYVNRGGAQPGYFDEEGSSRGLSEILSSASAGFGDLDDDGDLDLVINDSGASFLRGVGGQPRLYINDGTGNFTEKTGAGWSPATKVAQMDVQLVDVDKDWDLDFVGYNRASNGGGNHYLMLNDGSANFSDSSSLLPNGSTSCYEAELGDLDGDTDLDVFMVSLSGFREGAVRNEWIESGETALSFTAQAALAVQQDDNEIALCDYDDDGDLDAFVGSLGTKERLWRNDGGLVFTADHAQIETVGDSTLDCTFADLDNDGDYDFVTAQGESNSGQWANKVYLNTGGGDTRAPVSMGERVPAALETVGGPWVALGRVQDAVVDDGVHHVSAVAHYAIDSAPADPVVTIGAGSFSPSNLNVTAGTRVTFQNAAGTDRSVTSTTAPWTYDSGLLADGEDFQHAFVRPGVYTFSSTPGGFSGSVTVSGSADSVTGVYSGGGIHRFAMEGDASAPAARLVYELEFVDWPGNVLVTEARVVERDAPVGTAFCSGDGSGTACPCSNPGAPGHGCANGGGASGALLSGAGQATVADDSFVLNATDCPAMRPGLFFQGNGQVNGGAGVTFGDGLLCAGMGIVRLQVIVTDAFGNASSTISLSDRGGVGAGETKTYQYWFRDPMGPCGQNFNTTSGLEVPWN